MIFHDDLYIYIAKEKSDMPTTTETTAESSESILKQNSIQSGFFQSSTTGCEAILKPTSGILLSIPLIVGVFN